jgi:hypothetical protein
MTFMAKAGWSDLRAEGDDLAVLAMTAFLAAIARILVDGAHWWLPQTARNAACADRRNAADALLRPTFYLRGALTLVADGVKAMLIVRIPGGLGVTKLRSSPACDGTCMHPSFTWQAIGAWKVEPTEA